MDAPPVYGPGGQTCMVDDFIWPTPEVAESLITGVRQWAAAKECAQIVVVTPAADAERQELLDQIGLHPTTEWWTGSI
jgi:hypothetical protein